MITTGLGLGTGNWICLAMTVALPLALLQRIRVEEDTMILPLGQAYRDYQARTARLVPLAW